MAVVTSSVVRVTTIVAVVVVAVIAAVVSYSHMQQLAHDAGEDWRSWLIPLSIDGLVVAASMVLLTRRRHGLPGGPLAWVALGAGVVASLAANMADARPEITAVLVAGWPAVAFAVAFELLLQQRRAEESTAAEPVMPEPVVPQPVVTPAREPLPAADRRAEPVRPTWTPPPPHQAGAQEIEAESVAVASAGADLDESAATATAAPGALPDPTPWVRGRDWSPGPGGGDLVGRVRRVIEASTAAGARLPGRRAIAKQLNVSEHQVRVALDLVGATTGPVLNGSSSNAAQPAGQQSARR